VLTFLSPHTREIINKFTGGNMDCDIL